MQIDWQMVAAIATGALAVGIGVAFRQANKQLEATRKSTNAQIAIELFEMLRSDTTKENLRSIYLMSREYIYELSREDIYRVYQDLPYKYERERSRLDSLLDKFELLGSVVRQGIVDETLAIEAYAGPSALRLWHQSALYIKGEREKRGFFLKNYEFFAQRAFEYFKDKQIQILFTNHVKQPVDLIQEFQKKDYKYTPGMLDEVIKKERKEQLDKGEV